TGRQEWRAWNVATPARARKGAGQGQRKREGGAGAGGWAAWRVQRYGRRLDGIRRSGPWLRRGVGGGDARRTGDAKVPVHACQQGRGRRRVVRQGYSAGQFLQG